MIHPPPRSTPNDTRFPYQTLLRTGREWGSFCGLFHEPRPIRVEKGDIVHAVGSDSRCDDYLVRECKDRSAASRDRSLRQENPQYFHGRLGRRGVAWPDAEALRSEEHTSELQSLMRISYAVFSLKNK